MKPCLPMIGGAFLVVLVGCVSGTSVSPAGKDSRPQDKTADTNKGRSKIVGTWRFVRSSNNQEPDWGTKLDFTPDGKVAMHGPGYANAGTYSLEKNTLTLNATVKNTYTVAKLTDKELVLEIQLAPGPGNTATFEYRKE
jgi:uncharacterized protein (TIGR03066 family)